VWTDIHDSRVDVAVTRRMTDASKTGASTYLPPKRFKICKAWHRRTCAFETVAKVLKPTQSRDGKRNASQKRL